MSVENYLKEDKISHESRVDLKVLGEFRKEHDEHILKKCLDPLGVDYNYIYSPCSVGVQVFIRCRCKVEKDITNYEDW